MVSFKRASPRMTSMKVSKVDESLESTKETLHGVYVVLFMPPALTLPQLGPVESLFGRAEAQLPADHAGCRHVPQVVTHGAPFALLQNFNTTLSETGSGLQTHHGLEGRRVQEKTSN